MVGKKRKGEKQKAEGGESPQWDEKMIAIDPAQQHRTDFHQNMQIRPYPHHQNQQGIHLLAANSAMYSELQMYMGPVANKRLSY